MLFSLSVHSLCVLVKAFHTYLGFIGWSLIISFLWDLKVGSKSALFLFFFLFLQVCIKSCQLFKFVISLWWIKSVNEFILSTRHHWFRSTWRTRFFTLFKHWVLLLKTKLLKRDHVLDFHSLYFFIFRFFFRLFHLNLFFNLCLFFRLALFLYYRLVITLNWWWKLALSHGFWYFTFSIGFLYVSGEWLLLSYSILVLHSLIELSYE